MSKVDKAILRVQGAIFGVAGAIILTVAMGELILK